MKNLFTLAVPALLALSLLSPRPATAQPDAITAEGVLNAAAQTYGDLREYKGTCSALIDGAVAVDGGAPTHTVSSATSRVEFARNGDLKVTGSTMMGGSAVSSTYSAVATRWGAAITGTTAQGETVSILDKPGVNTGASMEFLAGITGISANSGPMVPAALLTDGALNPFRGEGVLTLEGVRNLGTTPCYVVTRTNETNKTTTTLWIEKASFLLRRFEQDSGAIKAPALTEEQLEKYPQLKGLKFPAATVLYTKRLLVFSTELAR